MNKILGTIIILAIIVTYWLNTFKIFNEIQSILAIVLFIGIAIIDIAVILEEKKK